MRYGGKTLFEDVSTTFQAGRRYGLTGPNGAGKSTFMNLLSCELEPQKGTVTRPKKVGVLRQDQYQFDQFRVIDTVVMGNQRLWKALEEREQLYAKADLTDHDGMQLGELEGIVAEEDGYTAESDAAVLLDGLDVCRRLAGIDFSHCAAYGARNAHRIAAGAEDIGQRRTISPRWAYPALGLLHVGEVHNGPGLCLRLAQTHVAHHAHHLARLFVRDEVEDNVLPQGTLVGPPALRHGFADDDDQGR